MTNLERAEQLMATLTRGEKARLLRWLAMDLGESFPGIEKTPNVLGGAARIVRTRIPVWTLVQARRLGQSEADLLKSYPSIRAEDLLQSWAYYRAHADEIDEAIAENEAA